jgi:hypothetical protein
MDDNLLKFFIAATTLAVVIQTVILIALFVAVRRSTSKMEVLAEQVRGRAFQAIDNVQNFLAEARPKIDNITSNVSESSTLVRNQLARFDATLNDVLDRTRLQVIRADELLSRTMDRVEETSDVVHKTVMSPLRQVNGLMAAVSTGVDVFLGHRRRSPKNGMGVPQDEMFI